MDAKFFLIMVPVLVVSMVVFFECFAWVIRKSGKKNNDLVEVIIISIFGALLFEASWLLAEVIQETVGIGVFYLVLVSLVGVGAWCENRRYKKADKAWALLAYASKPVLVKLEENHCIVGFVTRQRANMFVLNGRHLRLSRKGEISESEVEEISFDPQNILWARSYYRLNFQWREALK